MNIVKQEKLTKNQLREKRLNELLDNCSQQALENIIEPFGLTPAMFKDKKGGNVTTQHNANQGIFAKKSEEYNRDDYSYNSAKSEKKKEATQKNTMNSQTFVDEYTGQTEPTQRTNSNGKQVMNAELDHTIPLCETHKKGGWILNEDGRKNIASEKNNLHYTTMENNRKKGERPAGEALSEENGYDVSITQPLINKAETAITKHMPSTIDRLHYHSKELIITGTKEGGINALRQVFGIMLYEFVNSSFIEIKRLMLSTHKDKSLIDKLIVALKYIGDNVVSKLKITFDVAVQGFIQGFISNLITFVINSVITTSAKLVTIIREGMKKLLKAIKLVINPPKDQPYSEVCRQVTKIFIEIITISLGILFAETIKNSIAPIPFLLPMADILSVAVTGVLTAITSSIIIYKIDTFFDWLSFDNTETLQEMERYLQNIHNNIENMCNWLQLQFSNSKLYQDIRYEYNVVNKYLEGIKLSKSISLENQKKSINNNAVFNQNLKNNIDNLNKKENEILNYLNNYPLI